MIRLMKQLALIGPTASGKTSLSIALAKALDAVILSLDSLAIYRGIDIASAKPTVTEREGVPHFGIDLLLPNEPFDVTTYIRLYREVRALAEKEDRWLIIIGGTSFYLKMLLEGISDIPPVDSEVQKEVQKRLTDLTAAHALLSRVDPEVMSQIMPADRYRIEKMLGLYLQTGESPTEYFAAHPPKPVIADPLPVYEVAVERSLLRKNIEMRTHKMLAEGLIDEVATLEKYYGRSPHSMKAIGIKETLAFLDGVYDHDGLAEKIITHTGRLAKRQETFNRSQLEKKFRGTAKEIFAEILT